MNEADHLEKVLHTHPTSPFLFIGSGFSQRYLNIPTWEGFLRRVAEKLPNPFEFYLSSADSKLPYCASLLAKDFNDFWWKDAQFVEMREKYKSATLNSSSPIKILLSDSLRKEFRLPKDAKLTRELDAFRALNAEGIITTNWDLLLESLFPDYKVYIGQQSVVTQTPQNVGEIYKIHGCSTDPNSLVLTEEDYKHFKEKQAYLAAKLITIFVEHPVVFLGYSVSDSNIIDLLKSILKGLGTEEIRKLQKNLIFIQRTRHDRPQGIKETILVVEDVHLPVTNIVTDDFLDIYTALSKSKLKLPARVLRFCKEQLYQIVSAKEPSEKLCLLNIDEIGQRNDLEFVVGIGVAEQHISENGYVGISARDIFEDVIFGNRSLNAKTVLSKVLPNIDSGKNFLPIYKFLKKEKCDVSKCKSLKRLFELHKSGFKSKAYAKTARSAIAKLDFFGVVNNFPPEKAALFIPFLSHDKISVKDLKKFAQEHFEKAFLVGTSTNFRKLFCLYDYLAFPLGTS